MVDPKQNVQVGVPDEVLVGMKLITDLSEEICTCGRRPQTSELQPFLQGIADHDSHNGIFGHHHFFVFRTRGIIKTVTVGGIPRDICPRRMLSTVWVTGLSKEQGGAQRPPVAALCR